MTHWTSPLLVVMTLMLLVWIVSLVKRDASIVDVFWGLGFVLLGWIHFVASEDHTTRAILVFILVTLWGLRLSAHILWRSHGQGEDYRYRAMRERHGHRFPWISLFTVFLLQAMLIWLIAMPLSLAIRSPVPEHLTWLDALGLGLFSIGFLFEAIADWQLSRFRANPHNRGKVLRTGLWRFTRHPNYFGDATLWWGLFFFAFATPGALWTVYSPLLMTLLLMRVSGVTLLEKTLRETKPHYLEYVQQTNAFFPWFPRSR
ncbi:MAG: DUF1295 domain-containing protein [Gammaproteobacteria bacterium]